MQNITNIESRRVPLLKQKYPPVEAASSDIFTSRSHEIVYRKDEIAQYEILFYYRLMKKNYGFPHIIEVTDRSSLNLDRKYFMERGDADFHIILEQEVSSDEAKTISQRVNEGFGSQSIDWKYYVQTKSGDILELGTTNYHTSMKIGLFINRKGSDPDPNTFKEVELFISDLLAESRRLESQLLQIKSDFEKNDEIRQYFLVNVYLDSYKSAELMIEQATENEKNIRDHATAYDARTKEWDIPENREYTDKYLWGAGMYYQASCIYLFMALEGFINLIYHSFLIEEFRDRDFNFEQNMDIEKKIRLIPALCKGFENKYLDPTSDIISSFKSVRKYRNKIFHSKIEDSLMSIAYIEDGFFYNCNLGKRKEFPSIKMDLNLEDVLRVKKVVDSIISYIVDLAKPETKDKILKYIMKQHLVPFCKNEKGEAELAVFSGKFRIF